MQENKSECFFLITVYIHKQLTRRGSFL